MVRRSMLIFSLLVYFFLYTDFCCAQNRIFKKNLLIVNSQQEFFNKEKSFDKIFAGDKGKHFAASLISTVFLYKIANIHLDWSKHNSKTFAVCTTFTLGICKEIYDKSKKENRFSLKDMFADVAGISMGLVIVNQP
jgi:uncharacterized protein YfiM (DUF2279 family)